MSDPSDHKRPKHPTHDFDSPWKKAIEQEFRGFLALAAANLHDAVDWNVAVQFRNTELGKLKVEDRSSRQHVDLLAEVTLVEGGRAAILCHVEVQAQEQREFAERMFRYHIRIYERFGLPIFSLAFLIDREPGFRPTGYSNRVLDTGCEFTFRSVKLLDYQGREAELEASHNPFAFVLLAQLRVLETGLDVDRLHWKVDLMRRLLKKQFARQRIRNLLRLIDWIMLLPAHLEPTFESELKVLQEGNQVVFVSTFERMARKKALEEGLEQGIQEGIQKGIEQGIPKGIEQGIPKGIEQGIEQGVRKALLTLLEARFGPVPEALVRSIREDLNPEDLEAQIRRAAVIESLEEF